MVHVVSLDRKIWFEILLVSLLAVTLAAQFNFNLKVFATTIHVPDDYPTIQEAINAANPGDTILVEANTYFEHIVVNKSVSLIGQDSATTVIDGNGTGTVVKITADNVTISSFTIRNGGSSGHGIHLYRVSQCNISTNVLSNNKYGIYLEHFAHSLAQNLICQNNLTSNDYGIVLEGGTNNTIKNNHITGNSWCGLDVRGSEKNCFEDNYIANNSGDGISLASSDLNVIQLNNITGNGNYGIFIETSTNNSIINNTIMNCGGNGITIIDSNNIFIRDNSIIKSCGDGIYLLTSDNNIIERNLMMDNTGNAVWIDGQHNMVQLNELCGNGKGISLALSASNNTIARNNITDTLGDYGLFIPSYSNFNVVYKNKILNGNASGICIQGAYNNLTGNLVANNSEYGILLSSANNTLRDNIMTSNKYNFGVHGGFIQDIDASNTVDGKPIYYLVNCHNLTISDAGYVALINCTGIIVEKLQLKNNMQGVLLQWASNSTIRYCDNYYGLEAQDSSDIKVYNNNFINNEFAVWIGHSSITWDNGYPSGGNYWSDYTSTDNYSGPNQDQSGGDGIWDNPYYHLFLEINDTYPLAAPIQFYNAGTWNEKSRQIQVITRSDISNFQINTEERIISFNVTGEPGSAFCRIVIPNIIVHELWQNDFQVLIDGEPWPFTSWEDESNIYIYVQYMHSEHNVTIIPEFPASILLATSLILTTLLIVLAKHPKSKLPFF